MESFSVYLKDRAAPVWVEAESYEQEGLWILFRAQEKEVHRFAADLVAGIKTNPKPAPSNRGVRIALR